MSKADWAIVKARRKMQDRRALYTLNNWALRFCAASVVVALGLVCLG